MSNLSPRCDLADHISGLGGYFNADGEQVSFNDPNCRTLYSDILKDFEVFKKLTGGVIYQHFKLNKITKYNQSDIAKLCPEFKIVERLENNKTIYTYLYYGKEYKTLNEINKKGIFIAQPIYFETIFELLPYLPRIVLSCVTTDDHRTVVISDKSCAESEYEELLQAGVVLKSINNYRKNLANLYLDLVRRVSYKYEDRICYGTLDNLKHTDSGDYEFCTRFKIDYNFPIEFFDTETQTVLTVPHWSDPKYKEDNIVKLSKADVEGFLKSLITERRLALKYVRALSEDEQVQAAKILI